MKESSLVLARFVSTADGLGDVAKSAWSAERKQTQTSFLRLAFSTAQYFEHKESRMFGIIKDSFVAYALINMFY
ncbi:hypothetical protein OCU04_006549 [Sclerotinia nivalis]|uniref:Uncharacterized protein n=1 Tax=Sclerotinia nivalis TaxID=352851 RepID=A0A9X0DJ10_9HELO|nr:hypothetical protein OCU04_006549 [Sclerotinia nivalis]